MMISEYKHIETDLCHDNTLTLHDCVADRVECNDEVLRFVLPNGFWIMANHNDNNLGKTVRTDGAVVEFCTKDIDNISIDVFSRNVFKKMVVGNWKMSELIQAVNSGACTIEFIYQYRSSFELMWQCVIHSKKKPYYKVCQLHLPSTVAVFYWNNLRPECEW